MSNAVNQKNPLTTLHIYTRVSSDPQAKEGTSLEEQKKLGVKTAHQRKMKYVHWEEGSASSHNEGFGKRPKFQSLLDGIEKGEIKHLFVSDLNRLSRNKQNSQIIEWKLATNKVSLHTPAGIYELGNPQNDLMFSILNSFSQYDNQTRMERFRLGRFNKVSKGYWHGGAPPYGYDLKDKRLSINTAQSQWIKYIYEQYLSGKSIRDISADLLSKGVKTSRNKDIWSLRSIEVLLTNTHYDGCYSVTDSRSDPVQTYRVECPRILSESLIYKVQTERKKRSERRVRTSNQKHNFLLKGLLRCESCGRKFHSRKYEDDRQYPAYYCPSKERRYANGQDKTIDQCRNSRYLRIDETDSIVWDTVIDVLSKSYEYKETIKTKVMGQPRTTESQNQRKAELEQRLKYLKQKVKGYKRSLIETSTKLAINEGDIQVLTGIKNNIEDLITNATIESENTVAQLDEFKKSTRWVDWIDRFGKDLLKVRKSDVDTQQKFLQEFLGDITVETVDNQSHQLKLHFVIPYVDDDLIYRDISKKSKGYEIRNGSNIKVRLVDTSKKTYKTME